MRILPLLLAVLMASTTPLLAGEERKLSGQEILELLNDRTALGEHRGKATRQYFDPSGWTDYLSEGSPPDRGKWRVEGNQYCSKWGSFGGWSCYDVSFDGKTYFWIQGEDYRSPFTVVAGYKMSF